MSPLDFGVIKNIGFTQRASSGRWRCLIERMSFRCVLPPTGETITALHIQAAALSVVIGLGLKRGSPCIGATRASLALAPIHFIMLQNYLCTSLCQSITAPLLLPCRAVRSIVFSLRKAAKYDFTDCMPLLYVNRVLQEHLLPFSAPRYCPGRHAPRKVCFGSAPEPCPGIKAPAHGTRSTGWRGARPARGARPRPLPWLPRVVVGRG